MKSTEHCDSTTIEQLILDVKNKNVKLKILIQKILDNDIYIACSEIALKDKEIILPIIVELDGEKNTCVFTKKEWAEENITNNISVVKLKAFEWLKKHPFNYGLIINPNHNACIKFSSFGIRKVLNEFITFSS